MSWPDYNRRCCVRIGDRIYPIPVYNLTIKEIPRLDGNSAIITDISGKRRSNLKNKQVYWNIVLDWPELDQEYLDYESLIRALYEAVNEEIIDFCPVYPFDEDSAILDVVPEFTEELIEVIWNDQMRDRPGSLRLYESNPRMPASWIGLQILDTENPDEYLLVATSPSHIEDDGDDVILTTHEAALLSEDDDLLTYLTDNEE